MATQVASPEIDAEASLRDQGSEAEDARRTGSQGKDGFTPEGGDSDSDCIEVLQPNTGEEADDEESHMHTGLVEAMKKPERDRSCHEQLGGAEPTCASLQSRPRGRLWFQHVEINRKDLTLIDESPSASRILTPQKPAPRSGLRQRHLDAFFCAPSSPATPVTAAAQKATVLPIRTPTQQPKGRSLRPQKPRIDLSDDSLSSILALSSGSAQSDVEHNIGSEDGSNFSSEGENDSSSDAISAASTSTTNTTENTTEDSDSIPRVAPKRNPAQRIRTVKAQSEEEAAAAMNGVAPDVRNVDSFTYKCGIDLSLPPLHRLEDIFDDMAEKAMKLDLENVVKHLQGRKLKVITVCSGTESPLLALGLIRESLLNHFNLNLEVEHLFSAEIVPFKQAYIERNFSPPIIFRDVRELALGDEATTAYGAEVPVPTEADMLVAGFSCVDYSRLNSYRLTFESPGESRDTFRGVFTYAAKHRPKLIVLENVRSAPWNKIKDALEDINYCVGILKLDTKQYYLPHTRQRGYLVAFDRCNAKKAGQMGSHWENLMKELQRPASSSIEAFMLDEDDPRMQRAREEYVRGMGDEGPPAREVDWVKCQGRHQDYRRDLGLGFRRPMTGWEDNGTCKLPDYAWHDWGTRQVERIWDTLDIALLRNAKRGFDSQFKTRVWELSQNIDRVIDSTASGITGCLTPTGIPFVTCRGGPLIGLEALALQGLPIDRLLLTRESQNQLRDLAGNAMTSTVVGAAMIAALIVGYPTLPRGEGVAMDIDSSLDLKDNVREASEPVRQDLALADFRDTPLDTILLAVSRSIRLCLCEGRKMLTQRHLQRCELCGHTTCINCGGNPRHRYSPLGLEETRERMHPAQFEDMLKNALPMTLEFEGLDPKAYETLKDGDGAKVSGSDLAILQDALRPAPGAELRFQSMTRAQMWTVHYDSPHLRLELVLESRRAEWRLFAKPARTEPGNSRTRKLLESPLARMRPSGQSLLHGVWQISLPVATSFKVAIKGTGKHVPSWESQLGIQGMNDEVWSEVRVEVAEESLKLLEADISGNYSLLQNCGTPFGFLHKKESTEDGRPVFLFVESTRLGDHNKDCLVFANDCRRLNYGETRRIIAQLSPVSRISKSFGVDPVKGQVLEQWYDRQEVSLRAGSQLSRVSVALPAPDAVLDPDSHSCDAANLMLSCSVPLARPEFGSWKKGPWQPVDVVNEREFFSSFAWLTERVRQMPKLQDWKSLPLQDSTSACDRCVPKPPALKWKLEKDKLTPYEDPRGAGAYERTLKDRPPLFVTQRRIDDADVGYLQIGLNVASLVHRAVASLASGTDFGDITASWRLLTNHDAAFVPKRPKFVLKSNKQDPDSADPPGFRYNLRKEQSRSLTWMKSQEASTEPYMEEEVEEAVLPHLGWRAEGRATKPVCVHGGVLADQVGYGKTAITLGLIDAQHDEDSSRGLEDIRGKISVKATLVVVPSHLVLQWKGEVAKFLGTKYTTISIRTDKELQSLTIRNIEEADIIIMSWNIFSSATYLDKLAAFAALPEMPAATGRAFDAWFGFAVDRVAEHVEMLKTDGASLYAHLKEKRVETENDKELESIVPSKRLRGAQYRAALAAGKKQRAAPAPKKAAASKAGHDPFGLANYGTKKDWRKMSCPLLPMFHFNRLVVDEYTYLEGKFHTSITNLQANFRWVLSGTPPLGDFADIKSIAVFLGIKLGVDDDTASVLRRTNAKAIENYRTAAENFQAFKQWRSPAWLERRHEVAQGFLDRFVRQNIAEIDEIPMQEEIRPVSLPAAERAVYMELSQHLNTHDMKIRKVRGVEDNDRDRRLRESLGPGVTAEQALLICGSHFSLRDSKGVAKNAAGACEAVAQEREHQLEQVLQDLRNRLKGAIRLKLGGDGDVYHFKAWVEHVVTNSFGDAEATAMLEDMLKTITAQCEAEHHDPQTAKAGGKKRKAVDEPAGEASRYGKGRSKATDSKAKRSRKVLDDEDLDTDSEAPDDEVHTTRRGPDTLREASALLRRLSAELLSRLRQARFFTNVRKLQLAHGEARSSSAKGYGCAKCERSGVPLEEMSILVTCGHTLCDPCCEKMADQPQCVIDGCTAQAHAFQVVRATELGEDDGKAGVNQHYGKKLESIVDLIKNEIPEGEQVLLFIQFGDMMKKVADILSEHDISHYALTSGQNMKASNTITNFQKDDKGNTRKVLILNVSDESASGANLVNANHVIFLSPLSTQTQYHYESSMTQAIGRARRYGQLKTVKVYHFLSLKTLDVNIFEDRRCQRLVFSDGEYHLRDPRQTDLSRLESFRDIMVRKQSRDIDQ